MRKDYLKLFILTLLFVAVGVLFIFTPLEKVHPVRDLSLTEQADGIGGDYLLKTDGGLMSSSVHTVRENSSLTGFTRSYCHELNEAFKYFEQESKESLSKQEDANNSDFCYVIGCGDVLDIFVWQHPDLNREVIVRPDGKTSFPIAGEVQASSLTSGELSECLKQKLSYFIRDPQVTVTVRNSNSKKVFVLGEVNRPGVYLFTGEMTILEAISKAGGYTDDATLKSAILIRGHWKDKPYAMRIDLNRVLKKGYLKQNIILQPGDIIFLPKSFIAKIDTFVDHFFTRTSPAVRYYLDLDDPTHR